MHKIKNFLLFFLIAFSSIIYAENVTIDNKLLVKPKSITIDRSLDKKTADEMVKAAQLFYTFWDTGDPKYLNAAISPNFFDNTLPKGRPQGPAGPIYAAANFRKAVPDITCSIEDLLVVGNKVTARLLFNGTFKGKFNNIPPTNKPIQFFAIDILHIKNGKIVEDWHLEDNLNLLMQLNAVKLVND